MLMVGVWSLRVASRRGPVRSDWVVDGTWDYLEVCLGVCHCCLGISFMGHA